MCLPFSVLWIFSLGDVEIETLSGDALGSDKDRFTGEGSAYHIICYLPDERVGSSRISVNNPELSVEPVIVEYDTVNRVNATFGEVQRSENKSQISIALDTPISILKKQNIKVFPSMKYRLYGTGDTYTLVFANAPEAIVIFGNVEKPNGTQAKITDSVWESHRAS